MTEEEELAVLLTEIAAGTARVEIDVLAVQVSSSAALASEWAADRLERTNRGERVALVYRDGRTDDDYSEQHGVDRNQVDRLVAAGATRRPFA